MTFTVKAEGQYQLQVTFQKQSFDGKQWINEKDTDTKTVDFTISRNKAAVAKTGDDTMIAGWAGMAVVALAALFVDTARADAENPDSPGCGQSVRQWSG